jgi:hypothetical protein
MSLLCRRCLVSHRWVLRHDEHDLSGLDVLEHVREPDLLGCDGHRRCVVRCRWGVRIDGPPPVRGGPASPGRGGGSAGGVVGSPSGGASGARSAIRRGRGLGVWLVAMVLHSGGSRVARCSTPWLRPFMRFQLLRVGLYGRADVFRLASPAFARVDEVYGRELEAACQWLVAADISIAACENDGPVTSSATTPDCQSIRRKFIRRFGK